MKISEKLASMLTNRARAEFMAFYMPRMDNNMPNNKNVEMIEKWLEREWEDKE